ncbi:hypothetical protein DTO282F9_7181 [Paecilomyces variotii]|nr:hypothetical protein DTO282F9_7181 [Paecilomyces variotii]
MRGRGGKISKVQQQQDPLPQARKPPEIVSPLPLFTVFQPPSWPLLRVCSIIMPPRFPTLGDLKLEQRIYLCIVGISVWAENQ